MASNSSPGASGRAVAVIWARTGENAAASSTATHRSVGASAVSEPLVASARRLASSDGNGVPALGGCDESFSALTTRPTPTAASMSSSQRRISLSCLALRASFSSAASSRVDSSRATTGSSPAATTLRRSRRSRSSMTDLAASARSSHSATRNLGSNCSAIANSPAAGTSSSPCARRSAFCSLIAWRTAGMPPCSARSATGRWASGSSASTALRCARPGLSRLAFGR